MLRRVAIAVLVSLSACGDGASPPPSGPDRDRAVYAAVLHELGWPGRQELLLVEDRTRLDRWDTDAERERAVAYLTAQAPGVAPGALRNLVYDQQPPRPFATGDFPHPRVEFVSQAESDRFFEGEGATGWEGFDARWPDAFGLLWFSRVAWSADGREAVVYVGHAADWLFGSGVVMAFAWDGEAWSHRAAVAIWMA